MANEVGSKLGNKFKYNQIDGYEVELAILVNNPNVISIEFGMWITSSDFLAQMERFKKVIKNKVNGSIRNDLKWHRSHLLVVEWGDSGSVGQINNKPHYVSCSLTVFANQELKFSNARNKTIGVEDEVFTFARKVVNYCNNFNGELVVSPIK